jgi:hypothetical protein
MMHESGSLTATQNYYPAETTPPVWTPATPAMKVDVAINKDGMVWVLHDKPFPDYLEWIEFDFDTKIMTFITAGGRLQDLGIPIHPPMDENLARARSVFVMYLHEGQVRDMGKLPLIVQKNLLKKGK